MSEFHWWLSLNYPSDVLVTKEMHSESLWFALLQSMRQQHRCYMLARNVRDAEKRREVLMRCLMLGTVFSELLGELRCQLALCSDHEKGKEFHDLLYAMETDFEQRYEITMFESAGRKPVPKKEAKRVMKARNFR